MFQVTLAVAHDFRTAAGAAVRKSWATAPNPENHVSVLVLKPLEGLCNRLRAIDSGIAIAQSTERHLRVIWEANAKLNCRFDRLFEPCTNFEIVEVDELPTSKWAWRKYPSRKYEGTTLQKIIQLIAAPRRPCQRNYFQNYFVAISAELKRQHPDFDVDDLDRYISSAMAHELSQVNDSQSLYIASGYRFAESPSPFSWVRPVRKLRDQIDSQTSRFGRTIGVHIRRTDQHRAIAASPIEAFEEVITREIDSDPNTSVYLATDDPEVQTRVGKRFGSRILASTRYFGRDSSQGIEDAVVDLFCLAATQRIYGSFWTTFSQTAARMGGIALVVVRRDSVGRQQRHDKSGLV